MNQEEAIKLLNEMLLQCDFSDQYGDISDSEPYVEAVKFAEDRIQALENIKQEIKELKMKVSSESHNYLVGYISALSVVEGIIAKEEIAIKNIH